MTTARTADPGKFTTVTSARSANTLLHRSSGHAPGRRPKVDDVERPCFKLTALKPHFLRYRHSLGELPGVVEVGQINFVRIQLLRLATGGAHLLPQVMSVFTFDDRPVEPSCRSSAAEIAMPSPAVHFAIIAVLFGAASATACKRKWHIARLFGCMAPGEPATALELLFPGSSSWLGGAGVALPPAGVLAYFMSLWLGRRRGGRPQH